MRQQQPSRRFEAETLFWPRPALPIVAAVFLVGSFLYVWLRVEPALEYHTCGPYFYRQRAFLDAFLDRPGGLASYGGVLLAQFNCLNWLGALVFVLTEGAVFLAASFCLARISGRAPGLVALVPLFVLLLLRNRYGFPTPAISAGLLLTLTAFAMHASLPWRAPWLVTVVSGLISGLLFLLAGLWSALLFAILCCLLLSIRMGNRPAGFGCLALGLAAPLAAVGAGNLGLARLLDPWPAGVDGVLAAALYASVPVVGVLLIVLAEPAQTPPATSGPVSQETAAAFPSPGLRLRTSRRGKAIVGLAFLIGWAVVWSTFDQRQKLLAEMDYHASCGEYEAVLTAVRQVKALNLPARVRFLLALYHTGRLAEDLFSFRNLIEEAPQAGIGEDCRARCQPLFELGLINDAEHMAHEALEMEGERPDLLRLLARINLLKDRPQAAQVFLNVLSLIPFQNERADDAWPRLNPQMLAADRAFLEQVRAQALTNDVLHDGLPVGRLLEVVLAASPTNRMAFEYLMAYSLMDLDLKKAVETLRLLDNFSYARIPRSYEEALVLFQHASAAQVDLKGRAIRPETAERFRQFREAVGQLAGSAEGQAAIATAFGDTYWYYYFTARSREQAAQGQALGP